MVLPIDIVLVRHGQSEGNLAMIRGKGGDRSVFENEHFKLKHSSLYRLTSEGVQQAKAAGCWIKKNIGQLDEFYVSEYIRAMETAAYLNLPHAKWKVDFMLRERDWGQREYKPFEERMKYRYSIENRLHAFFFVPGRGESIAQMCSRLMKIVQEMHSRCTDKKVVIVCHSYVMRAFRVLFESVSQETYREMSKGFVDKNSPDYIHNGAIIHYTRRDPYTGRLSSKLKFRRCVNPMNPNCASNRDWMKMTDIKVRFNNDDLLEAVKLIPRILDNLSPSPLPKNYKQETFSIPQQYYQEIEEYDMKESSEEEEGEVKKEEEKEEENEGEEEGREIITRKDHIPSSSVDIEGDIIAITTEEEKIEEEDDDQRTRKMKIVRRKKTTRKTFVRVDRNAMKKIISGITKDEKKKKKERKKEKKKKTMFVQ